MTYTPRSRWRRRMPWLGGAAALAALVAVAIALSSGGDSSDTGGGTDAAKGATTVTWSTWGTPQELKRFYEFGRDFERRHPDIHVKLIPVPSYDDYHPKILTQLTAGKGPDVFYTGDDNIGKFVANHTVADLGPMMDASGSTIKRDDFFPGLWGAAEQQGHIYGVPPDSNPNVLWYRTSVLRKAGIRDLPADLAARGKWTTAAFQAMVDRLHADGKIGYLFWNWFADTYTWARANGGAVYDASGRFVLGQDPKSVAAMQMLARNFAAKKFVWSDNLPEGQGADAKFIAGKAGFESSGRWLLAELRDAKVDDADIVPFPTASGTPGPAGVATSYLVINKRSKHPQAAYTFLSEFVSKAGQIYRLRGRGNAVPTIKGADSVVDEGDVPHARTFIDVRNAGFADPPQETRVPGLPGDINKALEPVWAGKADVGATLRKLQSTVAQRIDASRGQ